MLRIRDVYPGSRILIFTHPISRIQKQQQKRGVKKISCHTLSWSHKFHKIVNYFTFEMLRRKKNLGQFSKNFYPKNCHQTVKNIDLGSGVRDPEKIYSGSRIQGSKRHRIPDPDPQNLQIDMAAGSCNSLQLNPVLWIRVDSYFVGTLVKWFPWSGVRTRIFWITDPDTVPVPYFLSKIQRNSRKKFNILSIIMIYYGTYLATYFYQLPQ